MNRGLDEIQTLLRPGSTIRLDADSFDGLADTLAPLGLTAIVLAVASVEPPDGQSAAAAGVVAADGTAAVLGVAALKARLEVRGEGALQVRLVLSPDGNWRFPTSFGALPPSYRPTPDFPGLLSLQGSLLDDVSFDNPTIEARNFAQGGEPAGLYFSGTLTDAALFGELKDILALSATPTLKGPIRLNGEQPADIDLAVPVGVPALTAGSVLHLPGVMLAVRTAPDPHMVATITALALDGTIEIGKSDPVRVAVSGLLKEPSSLFSFAVELPDRQVTIARGLDAVAELVGTGDLALPDGIDLAKSFYLKSLAATFDPKAGYVRDLQVAVQSDQTWAITDGFKIGDLGFGWLVLLPFDAANRTVSSGIHGVLTLGTDANSVRFDIAARLDDGFILSGSLREGDTINLTQLVGIVLGQPLDHPELDVTALTIEAATTGDFSIEAGLDAWSLPLVGPLALDSVSGAFTRAAGKSSGYLSAAFTLGPARLFVTAAVPAPGAGFTFSGGTYGPPQRIDLTAIAVDLLKLFGIALPDGLPAFILSSLNVTFDTGTRHFTFDGVTSFTLDANDIGLSLAIDIVPAESGYTRTVKGQVTIADQTFEADFTAASAGSSVLFAWKDTGGTLSFEDIASFFGFHDMPALPENLDLKLKDARFFYDFTAKTLGIGASSETYGVISFFSYVPAKDDQHDGTRVYAFALALPFHPGLSALPLVGDKLPSSVGISDMQLIAASATLTSGTGGDMALINTEIVKLGGGALLPGSLARGVTLAATLNAGDDRHALVLPLKTSGGDTKKAAVQVRRAVARPQLFSPLDLVADVDVLATVDAEVPATRADATPAVPAVPAAPGHAGGPMWFTVDKSFGRVSIPRAGLQYDGGKLFLLFDASLDLSGLTLGLDGLGLGSPLTSFDPVPHLSGLSIAYSKGSVEISGGFLAVGGGVYEGFATVKTSAVSLAARGMYATDGSMFIYGLLDRPPLGGPPIFYVDGLALGFGIETQLNIPPIDSLANFSLLKGVLPDTTAPDAAGDPSEVLKQMTTDIVRMPGSNWVAAGVRFSSFKIIESFALLVLQLSSRVEIDLIGISRASIPPMVDDPIAAAELSLEARLDPVTGNLAVDGKLSPSSFVLSHACHLTGGFAYRSWVSGEHAGDFVLTLGGYHPRFPRDQFPQYPAVERLGFAWNLSDNLEIKGTSYFALTPNCLMAGGSLEAVWSSGGLRAWFDVDADFLMMWKPFFYMADASCSIGVSLRVHMLFVTVTITVSIGADLHFQGPPFGGSAHVDLWCASFTIPFGDPGPKPQPIPWDTFRTSFLARPDAPKGEAAPRGASVHAMETGSADAVIATVVPVGGLLRDRTKDADFKAGEPRWIFHPERIALRTGTLVPATSASLTGVGAVQTWAGAAIAVGPSGIDAKHFTSTHAVTLTRKDPGVPGVHLTATPVMGSAPSRLWAEQDSDATIALGDKGLVSGTLSGIDLKPTVLKPDRSCPIPVASLQEEKLSREAFFAWTTPALVAADEDHEQVTEADPKSNTPAAMTFTPPGGPAIRNQNFVLAGVLVAGAAAARTTAIAAMRKAGMAVGDGVVALDTFGKITELNDWPKVVPLGAQ